MQQDLRETDRQAEVTFYYNRRSPGTRDCNSCVHVSERQVDHTHDKRRLHSRHGLASSPSWNSGVSKMVGEAARLEFLTVVLLQPS